MENVFMTSLFWFRKGVSCNLVVPTPSKQTWNRPLLTPGLLVVFRRKLPSDQITVDFSDTFPTLTKRRKYKNMHVGQLHICKDISGVICRGLKLLDMAHHPVHNGPSSYIWLMKWKLTLFNALNFCCLISSLSYITYRMDILRQENLYYVTIHIT